MSKPLFSTSDAATGASWPMLHSSTTQAETKNCEAKPMRILDSGREPSTAANESHLTVKTGQGLTRSRIAIAQGRRLSLPDTVQRQRKSRNASFTGSRNGNAHLTQNRVSNAGLHSESSNSVATAAPNHGSAPKTDLVVSATATPDKITQLDTREDSPAFETETNPEEESVKETGTRPGSTGATARPKHDLSGAATRTNEKSVLSDDGVRTLDASLSAPNQNKDGRSGAAENDLGEQKRMNLSGSVSNGDATLSSLRASATRVAPALDSNAVAADAVTTETLDNVSRSRRSVQVLRDLLGKTAKMQTSLTARHTRAAANRSDGVVVAESNPLRYRGRTSDSIEFEAQNHAARRGSSHNADVPSAFQGNSAHIDVRADDFGGYDTGGDYSSIDSFDRDPSFINHRGQLEWLRVPSLFYLFANIIKWNELQLQRRALMASWQTAQLQNSQTSLSLMSIWTQHRERELQSLESHISFSVFELEGIYLNRLLVRWSKPKIRSLVSDVASAWKKDGPCSAKFDSVSSQLFGAISSEEPCQLRRTFLFSLRQWIGRAEHRWAISGIFIGCFVVSLLCIVFLAAFGRTRVAVCIVLSIVLGVAVILMYSLAMLVLHHNAYASTAATYFRETAVQAAQEKMEEEEELDKEDEMERMRMRQRAEATEAKYGAVDGNGAGGLTDGDAAETDSEFTEVQIALAVRNLRALTEGTTPEPNAGAPYHRIPTGPQSGRREPGTASGGYYDDDMTLTDVHVAPVAGQPLRVSDAVKSPLQPQEQEANHDNALLLSTVTSEQHREDMRQQQSRIVQEKTTVPSPQAELLKDSDGEPQGKTARESTHDSWNSTNMESRGGNRAGRASDASTRLNQLQQLAGMPDRIAITALVYCNDVAVLSEVAASLWERLFMVLRVSDMDALDSAFDQGSDRFKVILIHAADALDGSETLRRAISWLQVKHRPVFLVSRAPETCAAAVPVSARLKVPFTPTTLHTLLLAGLGVEANLGSVSLPMIVPPEPSSSQPFQVPAYVLGRRLGGGAFGNVFEAEMEDTGAKCAVKRMYLKEDSDEEGKDDANERGHGAGAEGTSPGGTVEGTKRRSGGEASSSGRGGEAGNTEDDNGTAAAGSQLREIAQEVEIMSSLQHPNIVRYYFCERDDNCISIFMELCTGGSLSSLIHSGKLVNPPEIKLLLREVISAVAYLHNLRIVHRDLKPDNILFRHGHAKITDFGTAVHKHGGDLRLIKGTFAYMAPETLVGEPYGNACDVWSIGCIAAEVLSVDLPQHALGLPVMCEYYRTMGKDSALPIECDVPGVRDFLLACLQRNSNERSSAAELFYHPILQARDTSIDAWMTEVVERRRKKQILQKQMSRRIGPGGRTNNALGVDHNTADNPPQKGHEDGFDLLSDDGSVVSLDSSHLANSSHPDDSVPRS